MANPFTIVFGRRPLEMIERFPQRHEIIENFTSENANQQIYMITGIRGSGKTVLMSSIADTLQDDSEWITIDLNPELDLLQGLAARLSNHILCKKWFQRAKLNLSYLGLGLAIEGAEPITDLETAILRMLENIRRKKKRLLITIDEVTNTKQMRVFAAFFQIMLRQNLPVFLLMTGLYENIYELQSEKSLTFLYRAPKIQLQSLEMNAIKLRYQSVFQISEDQAREMTRLTGGYPFAFQLLGYLTWNHQGHYQEVLQDYRQSLYEYVYQKIWSELSPRDRLVLQGIAETNDSSVKSIKEHLHFSDNEWAPYRQRLIRKGIVDGSERGLIKITLPLFRDFVKDQIQFDQY